MKSFLCVDRVVQGLYFVFGDDHQCCSCGDSIVYVECCMVCDKMVPFVLPLCVKEGGGQDGPLVFYLCVCV